MLFRCKVSYLKTTQSAKASKPVNGTVRVFRRNESLNPNGPVFLEIQTSDLTRTFKINGETCKLICPPQQAKDKLTIQFKDTTFILLSTLTAADRNDFVFLIRSLTNGQLPTEIWKAIPISLTRLELNANRLCELPGDMMRLRQLETLNVANNQINTIHESAHKLLNLRHLDLSHNELRTLPASLLYGRKFSYLNIAGNRQLIYHGNTLKFPVRSNMSAQVPTLWQSSLATLLNTSEKAMSLLPTFMRIQWSSHVHPCAFCHRLTPTNELYDGTLDSRQFAVDYVTSNNFGRDLIKFSMEEEKSKRSFPTKLLNSFDCNQGAVRAVRFNVDGNYCITSGSDKTVALWNPLRQIHLKSYRGCGSEILDACGSCDNSMILAGGRDKQPTIFDVESGKMLKRWRDHGGVINAVAFNEDSRVALSASQDSTIRCFDTRSRSAAFQVIDEATDNVLCLDVGNHEIVSGSADGHVRLYDIREGRLFVDYIGDAVTSVQLTDDQQCCLVSSMDGQVRLFDKTNGQLLNDFNAHRNQEFRIESTMLKSGDQLASGSEDGHVYVYDVVTTKVLSRLNHQPTKFVHSLAAHPTRNDLLLSTAGRKIYVWTADSDDE
ncbi:WD-REPEATS-REGION domain-containing protein [Aphelenchoides besseyi]|nr:WD-REPEATS-REGION domain-containing protein [Aphelenchoides besseyi]